MCFPDFNFVTLPGKLCSKTFTKFQADWKVRCRQVLALPQPPQPPQPPCNIAAMQAEVGIVQSRSLERSQNMEKLEYVQVQTAAFFYFKSHGRPRKCRWKHHWNKMKPGLWHSCLTPRLHLKHKGCSLERQEFIELCVCACNQVRPSEPTCFPFVEFTAPPIVAGIGLGAEKLEGAHSFFSTAWGTSILTKKCQVC